MKKLLSILLALVLILSLATTAFAASGTNSNDGKIIISNAVDGVTYSVYQILVLESFNNDVDVDPDKDGVQGAYAYKAASTKWNDWLKTQTAYVSVDDNGYVTWVATDAAAAAFAKAALEFAKDEANAISATDSKVASGTTVEFTGLNLGYYLVDSSLGALCSLNTTDKEATIEEKNDAPSLEKKVKDASVTVTAEDDGYRSRNTADIGETVYFKVTITAQPGAENYVLHDKMSAGLSYTGVTGVTLNGATVTAAGNYSVVTSDLCADCDFHVTFTKEFCNGLKANDQIAVEYTAVLNADAVIDGDNTNDAQLTYGDDQNTTWKQTVTKTFDVTVFKWTAGGVVTEKKALPGAGFTLYYDEACESVVKIVATDAANVYQACKLAECDHGHADNEIDTDVTGTFTIQGLDAATYYLKETTVPAGYNKLNPNPITITIDENGVVNKTAEDTDGVEQVEIENKTGAELPETGGMGTTLIYTLGAILAVGSLILLVVKKRMAAAE